MAPESMVHALKELHQQLTPSGLLIDIHPTGEPPPITVRLGEQSHLVGWIREDHDDDPYVQADEALATAVSQTIYQLQAQDTFAFITHFDTLHDLQQYLTTDWTSAYLEELVAMQIESLLRSTQTEQEIIVKEIVQIAAFTPLSVPH